MGRDTSRQSSGTWACSFILLFTNHFCSLFFIVGLRCWGHRNGEDPVLALDLTVVFARQVDNKLSHSIMC